PAPATAATTDARAAIREADIKRDLYTLAADHYRGREAGTGTAAELAKVDVKGKAVALQFSGEVPPGLSFRRFQMATMRDRSAELFKA
nr:hypothetical protein [Tanacetum cinerariifolium]